MVLSPNTAPLDMAESSPAVVYDTGPYPKILDEGIQDDKSNVTRFLALAREPVPPREGVLCKTSIAISLKEGPGSLFKALACFALRDINLTKVESRPMRWKPITQAAGGGKPMQFSYLFYIDFEVGPSMNCSPLHPVLSVFCRHSQCRTHSGR